MEVKIQLNGVKAKDGAKVLTGAKIRGDGKCDIQAENIQCISLAVVVVISLKLNWNFLLGLFKTFVNERK